MGEVLEFPQSDREIGPRAKSLSDRIALLCREAVRQGATAEEVLDALGINLGAACCALSPAPLAALAREVRQVGDAVGRALEERKGR